MIFAVVISAAKVVPEPLLLLLRLPQFVAGLAETSHPELEALLLPNMLRSAMLSVVQVASITIEVEMLSFPI